MLPSLVASHMQMPYSSKLMFPKVLFGGQVLCWKWHQVCAARTRATARGATTLQKVVPFLGATVVSKCGR